MPTPSPVSAKVDAHWLTACSLAPVGKREGEILFRGQHAEDIDVKTSAGSIGFVAQNPESQTVTAVYAVSNVIFLLALSALMGEKLERITRKYGI